MPFDVNCLNIFFECLFISLSIHCGIKKHKKCFQRTSRQTIAANVNGKSFCLRCRKKTRRQIKHAVMIGHSGALQQNPRSFLCEEYLGDNWIVLANSMNWKLFRGFERRKDYWIRCFWELARCHFLFSVRGGEESKREW